MGKTMKWIIALILFVFHSSSYADWVIFGGAYKCGDRNFVVKSTIESSSVNYPADEGYVQLPNGKNKIACAVGSNEVKMQIVVRSPSSGLDAGAGEVILRSLTVNGKQVSDYQEMYGRQAFTPFTVKVEVRPQNASIVVETCKAEWKYEGLVDEKCEQQAISR